MHDTVSPRTIDALGLVGQIARSRTIAEAEAFLLRAIRPFGMNYYAAWIVSEIEDRPNAKDFLPTLITNWPDAWTDAYFSQKKHKFDPVVARASAEIGSFFWHELDPPTKPEILKLMEGAQAHGMFDGFTVSWRSLSVATTVLSLAGDPITWDSTERVTMAAVADSFIQRCTDLRTQGGQRAIQTLSPQEARILYLCALGKSDKEIMRHLNLQRGTVLTYWSRIRWKLRAADRTQAVAHGIACNQIVF
jgi:LuxR family transcriptional activator of conjugal transfer of Ti plasmids